MKEDKEGQNADWNMFPWNTQCKQEIYGSANCFKTENKPWI